jgi:hypothetical protein
MRSVRAAGWKLLQNRERGNSGAFDLAADPREQRLLCDPGAPLLVRALAAARGLDAALERAKARHAGAGAAARTPEEVERQLRDLGYTGAGERPR